MENDKVMEDIHRKALEAYFTELSKGMTEHFVNTMTKPYTDMLGKWGTPSNDIMKLYGFGKDGK